jgi:uncharacterized YigZ family protein
METEGTYKTIKSPSEGGYKEKGSKFLAFAYPVSSESEVKAAQTELRKKYYDARHHVYAFRIGADKKLYRCSDDGEPSNSSGPPVLGQIQSYDLTNILIVVVRYFGGTKLGVPGLIHAYRTAAVDAIQNAEIITVIERQKLELTFQYPALGEVMRIVKEEDVEIAEQEMSLDCRLVLEIKKTEFVRVHERFTDLRKCEIKV